jgi:hypothetical protein
VKPRAARPTEPRDSYASGIRIPHLPHRATHIWSSGSASRQASSSAHNEERTRYYTQKYLHVQAPTATMNKHRHSRCHYKWNSGSTPAGMKQPPTLEGLRGDKTPGGSPTPAPAAATTTSAPSGQTAAAMTSGRTLLRRAPRPRPHSRGEDKLPRPWSRRSVRGWRRLSRRRRNLFRLPRWEVAPEAVSKPVRPESQTRSSCQRHGRRTPSPRSLREGAGRCPRGDGPQLGALSAPARMTKILEAEGGAEVAARFASPHHQTGGHRLG